MLQVPYRTDFNYYPNEPQTILESTLTEVLKHANLLSFNLPTLCEVDYDAETNLYAFELVLQNNIAFYDSSAGERDVRRMNHHFQHLQTNCAKSRDNLYNTYCARLQQYQYEVHMSGRSTIIPEQSWVEYLEYCKKWQYFLFANIVFVSCTKASYDRNGRICVVRFKIEC